jgi:TPP-dependent pyruvate/acetoin dehydrogenase alpha subunit
MVVTADPQLTQLYRDMFTIRRFEDVVFEIYETGELPGATHLYNGQEAVSVGVASALRPDDAVTGSFLPAAFRRTSCLPKCWARRRVSVGAELDP